MYKLLLLKLLVIQYRRNYVANHLALFIRITQ